MPEYKLTYFDIRANAEHIRLIFVVAGIPYEEKRISFAEWPELKPKIKFGQIPILEFDGQILTQSFAIGRYLGRKFKLVPEDELLAARSDEMVYHALELQLRFRDFFREEDEEKKAELKTELAESLIPKYYPILEELVGAGVPGPFIAGRRVSWHDLYLANWLEIWEENIVGQEFLDDFPALKKLKEAVFAIPAVKIYLRKRAKTVI